MGPDDLSRALAQPGRASIPYLDQYNPNGRWCWNASVLKLTIPISQSSLCSMG